jgi:predicted lipoprotein
MRQRRVGDTPGTITMADLERCASAAERNWLLYTAQRDAAAFAYRLGFSRAVALAQTLTAQAAHACEEPEELEAAAEAWAGAAADWLLHGGPGRVPSPVPSLSTFQDEG